jgi:hypothetical protein
MSEYINLGDVTYFGITLVNPSGGALSNADETPRYFLYRNASDTPSISANFIQRTGLIGTYRGSGDITTGNGFAVGDYVEVHASGKVGGIQGRAVIKSFVVGDMFNTNLVQWSGEAVRPLHHGWPSVNVMEQSGIPVHGANALGSTPVDVKQWLNTNVLLTNSLPAVALSGYAANLVIPANVLQYNGVTGTQTGGIPSVNTVYWADTLTEVDAQYGKPVVSARAYHDPQTVTYREFPLDFTNLARIVPSAILNANLSDYNLNGTVGSGLNKISANMYYAGIKFLKDSANNRDEYLVQWFRNSLPVSSGEVSNPALSVYRTSDGTALTQNQRLAITSVHNGVLRYNETSNLAVSGEPYLVTTSGTIDGALRVWNNPVGIDSL